MKNTILGIFLSLLLFPIYGQNKKNLKKEVIVSIESQKEDLITVSDKIWEAAEIAFQEEVSSETLIAYAKANGFNVEVGVAETPTAFVATYGSGKPVIGILGEFDALPGISQKAVPQKTPLVKGAAGHGCGHNMYGTASLGAAVAIKNLIASGKLKGTVKFFGTPAEEKFFGKLWMARAGLFDDLDACLDWHPADTTEADVQSSLALVDFKVEFFGQTAHASGDPWNGRSASDALELYTHGINAYREHVKPTVRMHYHIQDGGQVVNVVPDYARLWVRVRDTKREGMNQVYERVKAMAEGAAILANVDYKISLISGIHEILPNRTGGAAVQKNLETLGDLTYTKEELDFAYQIQEATSKPKLGIDGKIKPLKPTAEHPMGGSTDVGDVSFLVPVVRLGATVAPEGTPWHSWAVVACGGMSIGHKGMVYAAKALGMSMVDLFTDKELLQDVKAEFKTRKGDYQYTPMLPPGPPPIGEE
ncbi:amidohydrolase [Flavobacteriaceae bacterium]|mgnify:FL=1|jgi:aminobenzoyl-glutamate utilization protein B|nr:amidohydrolase [Flavobacteriaceae bacterium]MDA9003173.1 amidohydrolase [Flavobacteriaceae bacterium]MDA9879651.1 amidohydrolase [Flavobacteriaceae bacterium]MDC0386980.1 amidohydrolase [Flavobacteriaceae bacterium]